MKILRTASLGSNFTGSYKKKTVRVSSDESPRRRIFSNALIKVLARTFRSFKLVYTLLCHRADPMPPSNNPLCPRQGQ